MGNKSVVAQKESGAHAFGGGKNHDKPQKAEGAHNSSKHEAPAKSDGAHARKDKPLVHSEDVGKTHSGRPLPEETILKDSKIITSARRLAKRNE
jgi:hypothetical protein